MNFSLLELNLNSNFAQMAIVLWHIFHSSQASPFIKLPKCKHFYMLNYVGLHLGKSLLLPANISTQIYNLLFPRTEHTACTTTGGTGEEASKSAPSSTRILLAYQNKAFQNPSKWQRQFTILCWLTSNPYPSTLQLSAHHRQRNFLSLSRLCLQEGLELYMSKLLYSIGILCKTS